MAAKSTRRELEGLAQGYRQEAAVLIAKAERVEEVLGDLNGYHTMRAVATIGKKFKHALSLRPAARTSRTTRLTGKARLEARREMVASFLSTDTPRSMRELRAHARTLGFNDTSSTLLHDLKLIGVKKHGKLTGARYTLKGEPKVVDERADRNGSNNGSNNGNGSSKGFGHVLQGLLNDAGRPMTRQELLAHAHANGHPRLSPQAISAALRYKWLAPKKGGLVAAGSRKPEVAPAP